MTGMTGEAERLVEEVGCAVDVSGGRFGTVALLLITGGLERSIQQPRGRGSSQQKGALTGP